MKIVAEKCFLSARTQSARHRQPISLICGLPCLEISVTHTLRLNSNDPGLPHITCE